MSLLTCLYLWCTASASRVHQSVTEPSRRDISQQQPQRPARHSFLNAAIRHGCWFKKCTEYTFNNYQNIQNGDSGRVFLDTKPFLKQDCSPSHQPPFFSINGHYYSSFAQGGQPVAMRNPGSPVCGHIWETREVPYSEALTDLLSRITALWTSEGGE